VRKPVICRSRRNIRIFIALWEIEFQHNAIAGDKYLLGSSVIFVDAVQFIGSVYTDDRVFFSCVFRRVVKCVAIFFCGLVSGCVFLLTGYSKGTKRKNGRDD
jgi:hypothetical protein